VVNATCVDGKANVEFNWTPVAGDSDQWLEVSAFDNSFVNGTYRAIGPIAPEHHTIIWEGLPDSYLVWRISTNSPWGWLDSVTGHIPSCHFPVPLDPTYACGAGKASVELQWRPLVGGEGQYVDLSLTLNGFGEGTFVSSGRLPPELDGYVWGGLLPNQPHYYRINTASAAGWHASVTRSFVAVCPRP
jgi:hypothetical protein